MKMAELLHHFSAFPASDLIRFFLSRVSGVVPAARVAAQ